MFPVYEINPLRDPRWLALLQRHPAASVFHSPGWLEALRRTYGYEAAVLTTSQQRSHLENGFVFCRIRSWLTGRRIVSMPFSDHCAPLINSTDEFDALIKSLQGHEDRHQWKYIEIRPTTREFDARLGDLGFQAATNYLSHRVDLAKPTEEIFHSLHKKSVQRSVRRAERAGVAEECGKSERFLRDFYQLMIRTRARHGLPPPPYSWFKNLVHCMGDTLDLRLAYNENAPVAAIVVLHFKDRSYYKYCCSDERFHRLGVVPLLLWRAIVKAKSVGSKTFDLGRSAVADQGLITFKNRWNSISEPLNYWRFPARPVPTSIEAKALSAVKRVCVHLPNSVLTMLGTRLYRHMG